MSKIEWTQETWNPLIGCDKISPGCKNCYAIRLAWRHMHNPRPAVAGKYAGTVCKTPGGQLNWTGQINRDLSTLLKPLRQKTPTMYFVNSMSDLFHEAVPFDFIDNVFAVMAVCEQHKFQILTKRPRRMLQYFEENRGWRVGDLMISYSCTNYDLPDWPLPNVWLGVSVENQQTANERIPLLMEVPAAVRFLSCEPLLGPIDLSGRTGIDWVIVGGESGPDARPMHPDWVRRIRQQCSHARVPFFFKQWGEYYTGYVNLTTGKPSFRMYLSYEHFTQKDWVNPGDRCISIDGRECRIGKDFQECAYPVAIMQRVGKKKAGRLLEGRTWDEMPVTEQHGV